jgi:hypothetical protein
MGTAGTLQVVKRLFDVAEAHDWVLSAEWCPRGLMSIEDSLSRVAADSADRCSLPTLFREALCAHVWNAAPTSTSSPMLAIVSPTNIALDTLTCVLMVKVFRTICPQRRASGVSHPFLWCALSW